MSSKREQLLSTFLPSRKICDSLIDEFYRSIHPVMPILSRPEFNVKYEQFWHRRNQQVANPGLIDKDTFFCVIFSMLFCATIGKNAYARVVLSADQDMILEEDPYTEDMTKYLKVTEYALKICNFPARSSVTTLWAAMMKQTCRLNSDTLPSMTYTVAMMLRIAQSIGLHRDPSLFKSNDLEECEIRLRRALWWHLVYMDAHVAILSGLPPTIHNSFYDVRLPSTEGMLDEDAMCIDARNGVRQYLRLTSVLFAEVFHSDKVTQQKLDSIAELLMKARERMTQRAHAVTMLTFPKLSPDAYIQDIRKVQQYITLSMMKVAQVSLLAFFSSTFKTRWGNNPSAELFKTSPKAFEQWTEATETALMSLKISSKVIGGLDYIETMWHTLRSNQFNAIFVVLEDICINPTRPMIIKNSEILQRIGFSKDDFSKSDERMACVDKAIQLQTRLRLGGDTKFAAKKKNYLMNLYNIAKQTLERSKSASSCSNSSSLSRFLESNTSLSPGSSNYTSELWSDMLMLNSQLPPESTMGEVSIPSMLSLDLSSIESCSEMLCSGFNEMFPETQTG